MATETKAISRSDLEGQIAETYLRSLNGQGWFAVRVATDGRIYESHEPSPCYSESEYYDRRPHTATVWAGRGQGLGLSDEEIDAERDALDHDWFETNVIDLETRLEATGLELID